jgi:hypothetical protein
MGKRPQAISRDAQLRQEIGGYEMRLDEIEARMKGAIENLGFPIPADPLDDEEGQRRSSELREKMGEVLAEMFTLFGPTATLPLYATMATLTMGDGPDDTAMRLADLALQIEKYLRRQSRGTERRRAAHTN